MRRFRSVDNVILGHYAYVVCAEGVSGDVDVDGGIMESGSPLGVDGQRWGGTEEIHMQY